MRFLIIFLATIGIMMQTSFAGFPDKTIRLIVPCKLLVDFMIDYDYGRSGPGDGPTSPPL